MKKILFGSSIVLGLILTSFTTLNSSAVPINNNNNNNNSVNCYYGQCSATAASTGQRCRHCVSNEGDWYCWQH